MRFYDLTLQNPSTGAIVRRWTSHPNGIQQPPDPGALNVEFDILVSDLGSPAGGTASVVTVEGISIKDLSQAGPNFDGMILTLKGGMGKGLPLANPAQAGVLLVGMVYQCFGNWVGTEMTLDFVVVSVGSYTMDAPGNFSVYWPAGTPLAQGIANVLSTAYPGVKQTINISNLVLPNAEYGIYWNARQFSQFVQGLTAGMLGQDYGGVSIVMQAGQFFVFDGNYAGTTVQLQFNDLVGQPTWIRTGVMQVKTVMRGDIQLSNQIKMPAGFQNTPGLMTTPATYLPANNKNQSTFQAAYGVTAVRHIGNFRSPMGEQWSSIFECTTNVPPPPSSTNG